MIRIALYPVVSCVYCPASSRLLRPNRPRFSSDRKFWIHLIVAVVIFADDCARLAVWLLMVVSTLRWQTANLLDAGCLSEAPSAIWLFSTFFQSYLKTIVLVSFVLVARLSAEDYVVGDRAVWTVWIMLALYA